MRIIVAADKFKGSLTSFQVAAAIKKGILSVLPAAKIIELPMADGGDGFSAVLKHYLQTTTIRVKTVDPLHRKMKGSYQWQEQKKLAIVEMAVASGLALLSKSERDPLQTSTFGTGLLIRHAIDKGAKKIILGLGGSATNDGGMGLAMALGFTFKDKNNRVLTPSGSSVQHIYSIIPPAKIARVQFDIACDVTNYLYGKNGAAFVYAAQKGAGKKAITVLDNGLRNMARIIRARQKMEISRIKGLGAAGGAAAMIIPYFKYTMASGTAIVTEKSKLQKQLKNCSLLITGEGRIDNQSAQGKVVGQLIQLAKKNAVDVLLVCGQRQLKNPRSRGLQGYNTITLAAGGITEQQAVSNAANLLRSKVAAYFKNLP